MLKRHTIPLAPSPVRWFVRLVRALYENDPDLERESLRELAEFGIHITVDGRWRRHSVDSAPTERSEPGRSGVRPGSRITPGQGSR